MMKPIQNGTTLLDVTLQFFREDHWHYQTIENKPVIRAGYHGERGTWICFARCDEQAERIVFHSSMGLNIPPEYRPAVMEYLTRVNVLLPVGNFEMNVDSGDVRFKTSLEAPVKQITVEMVRALANTNVRSMDHYFPGVVAVMHAGLSPQAALARVEVQPEEVFE